MTLCKLGLVLSLMWGMASGAPAQWTDEAFPTSAAQSSPAFPTIESAIDFDRFSNATDAGTLAANSNSAILTQPWWIETQSPRLRPAAPEQGWDLDQLIWLAVEHSPWVQGVLVEPQIFQAQAAAATGQFDPNAFVDSIFRDTSDPVGNTLITGTAGRLNDHIWNNSSGLRAKNTRGGVSELSQDFNFKDSNSNFFLPSNQADTKMVMRYTQPLLRGAGVTYNRSTIVIASLRAEESMQDAIRQIQSHAFSIITAYWELVAARASYRQIERGLSQLEELRAQLVGRADIDTLKSQQLRAESAIYKQRAAQAKAFAQMHAAEANLRAAVAAPQLREQTGAEMIPLTLPADWKGQVSREDELASALNYHPEIQAIRMGLQAARVKLQVAENELRPTLNLVMEGYVRGLNGDYDAAKSFGDQFSEGAPSYSAGMAYQRPYRNTAARAILRERRLELRRTLLDLDHTLLSVGAAVESALAQLDAAFSELESAVRSTLAIHAELDYLLARWQDAFLDSTARNLLLDQLLNSQIQLIQAENGWARAQADHMLALARLKQASGSLLPMLQGE
jgi:outer membrane protein TolC